MANETVSLGSVQETMLMPLWGRAFEMKKEHPLLVDAKASEIVSSMDYDFGAIEKNIDPLTRAAWIARSLYFDKEICISSSRNTPKNRTKIPISSWVILPDLSAA